MSIPNLKNINFDDVMELCENDDNEGICCACGDIAYGVEPDACGYECESCGASEVYGAMELMIYMA